MKIAVAGCGIAGATAAFILSKAGHDVTVFEQAPQIRPLGAGFLLQPAGQQVLSRLGLLEAATKDAAKIDHLFAQHRSGKPLVRLKYETLDANLFAFGVHRGDVFSALLESCINSGVKLIEGCRITSFEQDADSVHLKSDSDDVTQCDILIAADGSRSSLRQCSGLQTRSHEYDYAAMWHVGPFNGQSNRLWQIVEGTTRLVGVLPIGKNRCSFFWGLKQNQYPTICDEGLERWKQTVVQFVPEAEQILSELTSLDEVTFATYRDVRMRSPICGRVVFVGDSVHAISPHLGQGVNLALADAECLANAILSQRDYASAFETYHRQRKSTWRFYSQITNLLTPFFQSDSQLRGFGRNLALPLMPQLPYVGKQMIKAMAGLKTGWIG